MPLTWSSKTQWKMQKTSPYDQKQILSQHVWQGDFCFQTLNKNSLSASLVFGKEVFLISLSLEHQPESYRLAKVMIFLLLYKKTAN